MSWPTVADLEDHIRSTFDDVTAVTQAQTALDAAVAAVQHEARQTFDVVEDDEVVLSGVWSQDLWLPEIPVIDVSAVSVAYPTNAPEVLASTAYSWTASGMLLSRNHFSWGGPRTQVAVMYSHGYAILPKPIRSLVLDIAGRRVLVPAGGVTSEEVVGQYRVAYGTPSSGLSGDEVRLARKYRQVRA